MRFNTKSFAAGVIIMLLCFSAAYAAGGIKSAGFNDNKVVFNGIELDISNQPMLSVVKEGGTYAANYMPIRGVLSAMGYAVAWDGGNGSVLVFTGDFLENSEDWLDFNTVQKTLSDFAEAHSDWYYDGDYFKDRVVFDPELQAVHITFDARHNWYIPTAVADETIYVERNSVNNYYNLQSIPLILSKAERDALDAKLAEYRSDPNAFADTDTVYTLINMSENTSLQAVWASYSNNVTDPGVFELRTGSLKDNGVRSDIAASLTLYIIDQKAFIKKADINPYLIEYGYGTID